MKIALLAVPFFTTRSPAIGLTQIKGRLKQLFSEKLDIRVFYLNHDLCDYLGRELYEWITVETFSNALGEWIFRQEAFEHVEPNRESKIASFYLKRAARKFDDETIRKMIEPQGFIRKVIRQYRLDSYDIVGINATFNTIPGLAFCRHLKKIDKNIVTVMGGAGVYMEMGEALMGVFPHLDYICSGSGLVSFPRLVEAIMNNNPDVIIDGILSRGGWHPQPIIASEVANNKGKKKLAKKTREGKVSEELDIKTPIELDYDDFFDSFYKFGIDKHYNPVITMETSRGCYWKKCKFCGLNENTKTYKVKPAEQAIREINHYLEKYKCGIEMVDNVMPRFYIKKVLPYIENPENRAILYETRGDYSKKEIQVLSRAGITFIQPGIESLCTDVHELMNKGVNAFQCISMLKWCAGYKILPSWNLVVGFPGMNEAMYNQLKETLPKVTHLVPPTGAMPVRFDRYSGYWCEPEKYDLELQPADFYQYIYPYGDDFLLNFAYYFEDSDYSSQRYLLLALNLLPLVELINHWKEQWKDFKEGIYPELYRGVRGKEPYIYDSREAPGKDYPVSVLEDRILKVLEEPLAEDSISVHFPDETPGNIAAAMAQLEERRLLFKENGKVMSLVIRENIEKPYKIIGF